MKYNTAYQFTTILKMFNGDQKAMQEFHENYIANRRYTKDGVEPSKEDYAIAKSWLKIGPGKTAAKFGISENQVQGTVSRVARYQMKYGK